jgi:translation initiation factor IF-3
MRVGLKISDHDLEVKANKVRKFLENGSKVKYTLKYKGRELAHRDVGFTLAQKIIDSFGEFVVVDQNPIFAGRQLSFVIRISPTAKIKVNKLANSKDEKDQITVVKESKDV